MSGCVNIQQMYPRYLCAVKSHMHRFARALNTALHVQHAVRTGDSVDDTTKVVKSRVFDIVLVRGKPFYGYHHEDCLWMKVIMTDPSDVKRASTLLSSGAILGRKFQPHESHIPFILQLKIDYNLHGMGWVWFRRAAFRKISDAAYGQKLWRLNSSRKEQTRCDMEADALVVDILNIRGKTMVNINDAPEDLRLVDSLAPIWADERRRQGTCSIDATPVTVERDVREFDTDAIEVWRGKFKEADDQRQQEGLGMQRGSVQDTYKSTKKDDGMSSLVDVGIIEHTQREIENADEATEWGERQREYGAMRGVPGGDEEDELAMLVKYIPETHGLTLDEDVKGSVDGLNRMWSQDDAPSQKQMGQHIREALVQDILSAETECRDIIEASQMYERQMNEHNGYRIPQVDGGKDCSDEDGDTKGPEPDRPGVGSDRVEAYASRDEVRNSIFRISQIREMFFGRSDYFDTGNEPVEGADHTWQPQVASASQEKLNFWREPASQVNFEEEFELNDEDKFGETRVESDNGTADQVLTLGRPPPSISDIEDSWDRFGLLPIVHQGPHYSNSGDIVKKIEVFAGKAFHAKSTAVDALPTFAPTVALEGKLKSLGAVPQHSMPFGLYWDPPSYFKVEKWAKELAQYRENLSLPSGSSVPRMDPNTGRLVPTMAASHTSQSSLMGTPMISSYRQNMSNFDTTPDELHQPQVDEDLSKETDDLIRPASPKYDEVDAFYNNPRTQETPTVMRGAKKTTSPMCAKRQKRKQSISQISPPSGFYQGRTAESQMGFQYDTSESKGEGLTIACIEVHAETRPGLLPDPMHDAVKAIIISVMHDEDIVRSGQYYTRILSCGRSDKETNTVLSNIDGMTGVEFDHVPSEKELFDAFVAFIHYVDPDILMGFEIQKESLGYLADRACVAFENSSLLGDISRIYGVKDDLKEMKEEDQYGWQHDSGLHVPGRIVLNLWRIIRTEVKLSSYSFQNCVASILRIRVPRVKKSIMHAWFENHTTRWRCLSHLVLCGRLSLQIIEQLDFIGRTSELARTFGIDFFSVISRGSQYRVESMMVRLAHSQNFIVLSPNNEQVARQPAMEALPLVMEPESGMYEDPVCVLDFQSLYPSMIIAYNLCFSTCLGRPSHIFSEDKEQQRLGCHERFKLESSLLELGLHVDDLIIAPNGVAFVPSSHRKGVLPRLLREILETRIMIKRAMKNAKGESKSLLRSLNAKQFALKLIANVTYGYTAAGFSGRMPMAELADAIVQSGRETLEATIRFIKNHPTWNADVIYGDTDSIFVRLPGRSVPQAHDIGQEIARTITSMNPDPVLLKLEKVYHPCFLLSKKRYVGAMYETRDQKTFDFDAKGIETVRRDSCPAVVKIMEQALRILFTSADISSARRYVERQFKRIISGRVSILDFIFAKEVRLGTYRGSASSIPPAALIATKAMAADPRAEPRFGERIPYVVVHGEPGARLIDMVVPPENLVESGGQLRLHAVYYITKQIIPALERFLSLIGADVRAWYAQMPKVFRHLPHKRPLSTLPVLSTKETPVPRGHTIDRFYLSRHCVCCDGLTMINRPLCTTCEGDPQLVATVLPSRLNRTERQYVHLSRICTACGGSSGGAHGDISCTSLDCGIYFERRKVYFEVRTARALESVIPAE